MAEKGFDVIAAAKSHAQVQPPKRDVEAGGLTIHIEKLDVIVGDDRKETHVERRSPR